MKQLNSIRNYQESSTWWLLGLGVITYGVYFAYYIKRQTARINEETDKEDNISLIFINTIFVLSYISLGLFFAYLLVDEGHPIAITSNIIDRALGIMILVWGFMARNRMNQLYETSRQDKEWFHGLWTFLFSPLYFNFKINSICEDNNEQDDSAEA